MLHDPIQVVYGRKVIAALAKNLQARVEAVRRITHRGASGFARGLGGELPATGPAKHGRGN